MKRNDIRSLLRRPGAVVSLGVHDVFSAAIAERAGVPLLFLGGFGTTASLFGQPDLSLLTLTEMAAAVKRVAARISTPFIADGDTGYGGLHNVARTVREFERAGASGVILEDQVFPKRCGHFEGKAVIPAVDMVAKLRAAVASRGSEDFVIVARTDARDVHGLADAIRRVRLYRKAGADVVFIESPHTREELALIAKEIRAPLLANMLTGGKTPNVPTAVLAKMGYKIVVYPIESLQVSLPSLDRLARTLVRDGNVSKVRSELASFSDVKKVLGLENFLGQRETTWASPKKMK